jgi:hypothetical protein
MQEIARAFQEPRRGTFRLHGHLYLYLGSSPNRFG